MKVYCASKARHASWWRALRAAGVPIVAPWIDWPGNVAGCPEPSADAWELHWSGCISHAADADICLFVANELETQCGALIEAGAALAAGKRVFVVSDYEFTFAHHPRCRSFSSIEDAITAIMSGAQGESLRLAKR